MIFGFEKLGYAVSMAAPQVLVSLAEYDARTDAGERLEYTDGVIEPMPNKDSVHDVLKACLNTALARQTGEGVQVVCEMAFALEPDIIRHPDVAVLLREPPTRPGAKVAGAPDLAVEIVSESDYARQLDDRVELYLEHGAQAVWVVWPDKHRIDVHQPGQPTRHLRGGWLRGEKPVSEFRLDLDTFFSGI